MYIVISYSTGRKFLILIFSFILNCILKLYISAFYISVEEKTQTLQPIPTPIVVVFMRTHTHTVVIFQKELSHLIHIKCLARPGR